MENVPPGKKQSLDPLTLNTVLLGLNSVLLPYYVQVTLIL